MRRSVLAILVALVVVAEPAAQSVVRPGVPIVFAADHDGEHTTHYRLYLDGKVVLDLPRSDVLSGGQVTMRLDGGLPAGIYVAELTAVNVTDSGIKESARSNPLTFTVASGSETPSVPTLLQPINLRIFWPGAALPPATTTERIIAIVDGNRGEPRFSRTLSIPRRTLLVLHIRASSSRTVEVTSVTGAGTWARAVRAAGSDDTRRIATEFWWTVTTPNGLITDTVSVELSEPVNVSWGITGWSLAGDRDVVLMPPQVWEQTTPDSTHPSAPVGGVEIQVGDLLVAGGVTQGTIGRDVRAGDNWTLNESHGTRGLTQYRVATFGYAGERGLWWGLNERQAISAMLIFRRQ